MKKLWAFFVLSAAILCGCSNSTFSTDADGTGVSDYFCMAVMYENGAFYTVNNGTNMLMYYSMDAKKYVPVCTKPNCTHNSKTSPDCNAVVNDARGIYKFDDRLYFFDFSAEGRLQLIQADLNGSNRRVVSELFGEYALMYNYKRFSYAEDHVLVVCQDILDLDNSEERAPSESASNAEYYTSYIVKVDLNTGKTEELVKRRDHLSTINGAVIHDNRLIYSYWHYEGDPFTQAEDEYVLLRGGIYSVDLATGEETLLSGDFQCMLIQNNSFDSFEPEKTVCYSLDRDDYTLYIYDMTAGTFEPIGVTVDPLAFTVADGRDIVFLSDRDDGYYTRYNIETKELSELPILPEGRYLSGCCIAGVTLWFSYDNEDDIYCRGYMSRADFMAGKYDDYTFAYYINSMDGEQ